jgi:hypothetical protein
VTRESRRVDSHIDYVEYEASNARGLVGLSHPEAEQQLTTLFSKMGARTGSEAIAAAMRRGLLVQ